MNQQDSTLLVEVLLVGARIKGLCKEEGRRRRLIEILNTPGEIFELESAVVKLSAGAPIQTPSLTIEKKAIVAAIPWETRAQDKQRAFDATVMGRSPSTTIPMVAFAPPYVFAGIGHVAGGYVLVKGRLHADPNAFSRFFPVTETQVTLPDGAQIEAPVVLVNRDLVSAMGRLEAPAQRMVG